MAAFIGLILSSSVFAQTQTIWYDTKSLSAFLELQKGVHPDGCKTFGLDRLSLVEGEAERIKHIAVTAVDGCRAASETSLYQPKSEMNRWPSKKGESLEFESVSKPGETLVVSVDDSGLNLSFSGSGEVYELRQRASGEAYRLKQLEPLSKKLESDFPSEVKSYRVLVNLTLVTLFCPAAEETCLLQFADRTDNLEFAAPSEVVQAIRASFGLRDDQDLKLDSAVIWGFGQNGARLQVFKPKD